MALGATLAAGLADTHQVRICLCLYYNSWIIYYHSMNGEKIVAQAKPCFVAGCS